MKDSPYIRLGLSLLMAVSVVLLVIGSPVSAELTGRAGDRRELIHTKQELLKTQKELAEFRKWAVEQLADANKRAADTQLAISNLSTEAKQAFRDTSWLKDWIAASKRR